MTTLATFKKAMFFGFAGTVAMTVYSFLAQAMNFPKADLHGMLASYLDMGNFASWGAYFGLGIFLAYLYVMYFHMRLPTASWMKGMVYAVILWAFMQMIVMPMMGMGFFSESMTTAFGMLIGMGCYGAMVGYLHEH